MQLIKIFTTIVLFITVDALASDTPTPSEGCTDVNSCLKKFALRGLGRVNARRANEVAAAGAAAAPEIAV